MASLQKISPFLWFNDNAEEAILHYLSIFRHAKIISTTRYGDAGPGPKGSLMSATFQLEGVEFMALNGGPHFRFTEAISLFVRCESQNEVDFLWEQLGAGGQPGQCGWLKDKFGLSWQIVPVVLLDLLQDRDPEKAARVMHAMLKMNKIDIRKLQEAYHQPAADDKN